MDVVIVESPAKAKTIGKYLGAGYKVVASFGHVRDLPAKDGSVDPANDFAMEWEVDRDRQKQVKAIADDVKGASRLILATDPDREGEAISWHLLEVLKARKALPKGTVERVTFNEITKPAILKAMAAPRQLDTELIDAYLARRALDYLVGFTLSPVLWRKLPGARSAGRVQSVALRLICDRETEIEQFVSREYWTVAAELTSPRGDVFPARLTHLNGRKLDQFDLGDKAAAEAARADVEAGAFTLSALEQKPVMRHPQPPFTTSTLQQEAARKLGFSATQTMRTAQALYEGAAIGGETVGLITYMRTDGVQMAGEAIAGARALIASRFGASHLPDKPRVYQTKAKNAQEAHEAIRPTDMARTPDEVARYLKDDQRRLYELVWKRAVASQMASARLERTTADLTSADGKTTLRATGQVVQFAGFMAVYQEDIDDRKDDEDGGRLPALAVGDKPKVNAVTADQHFTQPPPRYSEASLVKKMEELGIGRPSTYASILQTLRDRAYVVMDKNRFIPEDKGRLLTAFLEKFFERYVEYDFTADLETQLDEVSAGNADWKALLRAFWNDFEPKTREILELKPSEVVQALDEFLGQHLFPTREGGTDPRRCPTCAAGRLSLKVGKFGAFIGCSNYPECRYTRPFAMDGDKQADAAASGPRELGTDPQTGLPVTLRDGRFGPYVQLGDEAKPPRATIPRDVAPDTLSLDLALALLRLPREVGQHPETATPVTAAIGRYGPYILHDGTYVNLKSTEEVLDIGLNRAVVLLAEKRAGGGRGRFERKAPAALRELGAHPESGAAIKVMDGRYGPYVTDGTTNATLPKTSAPEAVSLEQAVELLRERAAKGPAKGRKPARKAAGPAKAAGAKKATAKAGSAKAAAAKNAGTAKPASTKKTAAKTGTTGKAKPKAATGATARPGAAARKTAKD